MTQFGVRPDEASSIQEVQFLRRQGLGPRPKTFLPLRRVAASLGKVSHKKFGRLRLVPKSGLSAELLATAQPAAPRPTSSGCHRRPCEFISRARQSTRRVQAKVLGVVGNDLGHAWISKESLA